MDVPINTLGTNKQFIHVKKSLLYCHTSRFQSILYLFLKEQYYVNHMKVSSIIKMAIWTTTSTFIISQYCDKETYFAVIPGNIQSLSRSAACAGICLPLCIFVRFLQNSADGVHVKANMNVNTYQEPYFVQCQHNQEKFGI